MASPKDYFSKLFGGGSVNDPFDTDYKKYTNDLTTATGAAGLGAADNIWNGTTSAMAADELQRQASNKHRQMLAQMAQTTTGTTIKQKTWSLYVAMKPVPPDGSVEEAAKQMYESACALAMVEGVKFSIRDGCISTVSRELSLDGDTSSIHAACREAGYAGAVWMEMTCEEDSYEPFKAMITSLDSGLRVRKMNTGDMLDDKHRSLRIAAGTPPVWVYKASDMTFDIYRGE